MVGEGFGLSNLGQTMSTPRRLPGARDVFCPSGIFQSSCPPDSGAFMSPEGELFGMGQERVPDDYVMSDVGQQRIPDTEWFSGLGQQRIPDTEWFSGMGQGSVFGAAKTGVFVGSMLYAAAAGLVAWFAFRNAPKDKGFWKIVGYAGGTLLAINAVSGIVMAFTGTAMIDYLQKQGAAGKPAEGTSGFIHGLTGL